MKDVDEKADTNGAFNANNGKNSLYIVDCKFSPSGNYFAICTSSKMLLVWDTSSWSLEFNRLVINILSNPFTGFKCISKPLVKLVCH